jgi:hypothetical protein
LRNAEPGDEHIPPELLRWEFATYIAEGLVGCHVKSYFSKNEEIIRQGWREEPVYAGMKRKCGRDDDDKRPKKKRQNVLGDSETLDTIVVEAPES